MGSPIELPISFRLQFKNAPRQRRVHSYVKVVKGNTKTASPLLLDSTNGEKMKKKAIFRKKQTGFALFFVTLQAKSYFLHNL